MASCLTESEKERIRYHLGYLEAEFAGSIQLGIPRPLQTIFILEEVIQNQIQSQLVCARIRRILTCLDQIEDKLKSSQCMLGVEKLGELTLHPLRHQGKLVTDSLENEYRRWAFRLADILGVGVYPYSDRFRRRGPGSSIPVSG